MGRLHLTRSEVQKLRDQLRTTNDAHVFRRTLALLEAASGRPISGVARLLNAGRESVYRWIDRYQREKTPFAIFDEPRSGRPSSWTVEREAYLLDALSTQPQEWGYWATVWTAPLLREHLRSLIGWRPSDNTIRRKIHDWLRSWKRPRHTLLPDPDREKKTPDPEGCPQPTGRQAVGRPHGLPLRRRDGRSALPPVAIRLGRKREADTGRNLRRQRQARRLRRHQL